MLHNFVLYFAISRKVARFTIVVIVVVLLLVAVAVFITKLFLWFLLLDYIKIHQFRSLRLVMSMRFGGIQLSCPFIVSFA
jgi:hypothetical protein